MATSAKQPNDGQRIKGEAGLKTIIPAPGWWAIFEPAENDSPDEPLERPLVGWALVVQRAAGGRVVGLYAYRDGIFFCDVVATFVRYEYRGQP